MKILVSAVHKLVIADVVKRSNAKIDAMKKVVGSAAG